MDSYKIDYTVTGLNKFYVCVGVTEDLLGNTSGVMLYGGVPSGLMYIVVRNSDLNEFFDKYATAGKSEAISTLFMIPGKMVNNGASSFTWLVSDNIHYFYPAASSFVNLNDVYIPRPTTLGISQTKYTPKNNKLLTKQFNFIMGDNQVGGTAPYYYEYFYDPTSCHFKSVGVLTPGCSIKCWPTSYKYSVSGAIVYDHSSYSEGLMAAKLPIGSWNNDIYTNWLTQNGVNVGLSIASSTLQIAGGAALASTGAGSISGGSSIASGALGIANTIGQVYEHTFLPNQVAGNINSGDITFSNQDSVMKYYRMTIKEEYAKIIDDYFSAFGYQINEYKVPNITGRRNWNYVKTIDCNIEAYIPQNDLLEIKDMFNKGITIWHNPQTFLDYSQTNDIVA